MSKILKFRAWYEQGGYMMPVEEIDFNHVMINKSSIWRWFNEVELMQYTGLKDKNGVDIYENDLLKCTCKIYTNFGSTETGEYDETIKQVIWKDDGWGTRVISSNLTGKGAEKSGLVTTAKYAEVIGNIYENPELL